MGRSREVQAARGLAGHPPRLSEISFIKRHAAWEPSSCGKGHTGDPGMSQGNRIRLCLDQLVTLNLFQGPSPGLLRRSRNGAILDVWLPQLSFRHAAPWTLKRVQGDENGCGSSKCDCPGECRLCLVSLLARELPCRAWTGPVRRPWLRRAPVPQFCSGRADDGWTLMQ
jgi:hypothetical protein